MTSDYDELTWPLNPQVEIAFKQVMAYILQGLGFDSQFESLKQIRQFSFCASASSLGAVDAPKDEDISEQNITVGLNICRKLIYASKSQLFEPGVSDKDVEPFLPKIRHSAFSHYNVLDLQYALFAGFRNEHIDTPILRFIIARKLDVDATLHMLLKCWDWRVNVHPVDKYLLEGDGKLYMRHAKSELIDAFRLNQIYLRGYDRERRPLVFVQVCRHFRHLCPDHDFERVICLIFEWTKLRLEESKGVNKGSILFDMTAFSLKNADLHAVKFLASAFEANYPEYLGVILIHKAPWIFGTVWRIIRPWIDQRVASKIHFTYTLDDLKQYINVENIPSKLGGKDDYDGDYVDPTPENCNPLPVDYNFEELLEKYFEVILQYIQTTISYIRASDPQKSRFYLDKRLEHQREAALLYTKLDPYIRYKGLYERCGEVKTIGL